MKDYWRLLLEMFNRVNLINRLHGVFNKHIHRHGHWQINSAPVHLLPKQECRCLFVTESIMDTCLCHWGQSRPWRMRQRVSPTHSPRQWVSHLMADGFTYIQLQLRTNVPFLRKISSEALTGVIGKHLGSFLHQGIMGIRHKSKSSEIRVKGREQEAVSFLSPHRSLSVHAAFTCLCELTRLCFSFLILR